MVFAGCLWSQEGGAKQLKEHKNIHVVQMDITSDEEMTAALDYVTRNLPLQGENRVTTCSTFRCEGQSIHSLTNTITKHHYVVVSSLYSEDL